MFSREKKDALARSGAADNLSPPQCDARERDGMRRRHLLPVQTSQKQQSRCPENIVNIEPDLSAGNQRISKGYLIDRVAQRWLELGWERGRRECFFGNTPAKTATRLVEAGISSLPVELGRLMCSSGGEGIPIWPHLASGRVRWHAGRQVEWSGAPSPARGNRIGCRPRDLRGEAAHQCPGEPSLRGKTTETVGAGGL
jgi:hypothetical protein